MVDKDIEEKVKVGRFLNLLNQQENSWVEINGKKEFKIYSHRLLGEAVTLSIDGDYVCINHYYSKHTLIPGYIEKLHKTNPKYRKFLNVLKEEG